MAFADRFQTLAERSPFAALWRMRYYAGGLALQKGLPVALLPLLVMVFGRETYSQYALLFTTVQIYSAVSSVGLPFTIIPMWFRQRDPLRFVSLCYLMIGGLALIFGTVFVTGATIWGGEIVKSFSATEAALWVAGFALLNNFNQASLNVARSEGRQAAFFWACVLGGVVLLLGITAVWGFQRDGLRYLILIQVAAFGAGTLTLLGRRVIAGLGRLEPDWPYKAARLLRFSAPLAANTLVLLLAMSIDKWTALAFFSREQFATYVIDYQAAFAIMFVPAVVALYCGPVFSELVANRDWEGLAREERKARIMVVAGSVFVAVSMYIYAAITNLHLTPGYWVLALTFVFQGLYLVRSNRLMAQMRSAKLLISSIIGVSFFALVLLSAGITRDIYLLYMAYPLYDALLFAIVSIDFGKGQQDATGAGH